MAHKIPLYLCITFPKDAILWIKNKNILQFEMELCPPFKLTPFIPPPVYPLISSPNYMSHKRKDRVPMIFECVLYIQPNV